MKEATMGKRKIRQSTQDSIVGIVANVFCILFAFLVLYPFWTVLMDSFSAHEAHVGLRLLPDEFTIAAYEHVLSQKTLLTAYGNTFFRAGVGTLLCVLVTFLASYPLSKHDLPFGRLITYLMLVTMYFSGGLIPNYLMIKNIGLMDSRWVLVLPTVFTANYIIVMRNFARDIPQELEESAFLDGANDITVAFRIFLPLMKPIIATIALWAVVAYWNEWFNATIYIQSQDKVVMQVLLRRLITDAQIAAASDDVVAASTQNPEAVKAATIFITILPILCSYPFAQKYFVNDLTVGAVKG